MIAVAEYRRQNQSLMEEYENRVRNWLSGKGNPELANKIPFFRDGIATPEVWFQAGNDFRPMIILKEVSLGINEVCELEQFLNLWGHPKYFDFIENPFDDLKIGTFTQWQRIARLVKGLEEIHYGASDCDYYKYNFSFQPGGALYAGDIEGYKTVNPQRTANPIYNGIVDRMAVIEIKKVGAGQTVNSELSLATGHYADHIEPFSDLLCRQIELINPTVIICLGREWGNCTSHLLKEIKENTGDRLWIDGYHHTRSSNLNFYENPLNVYKEFIKK